MYFQFLNDTAALVAGTGNNSNGAQWISTDLNDDGFSSMRRFDSIEQFEAVYSVSFGDLVADADKNTAGMESKTDWEGLDWVIYADDYMDAQEYLTGSGNIIAFIEGDWEVYKGVTLHKFAHDLDVELSDYDIGLAGAGMDQVMVEVDSPYTSDGLSIYKLHDITDGGKYLLEVSDRTIYAYPSDLHEDQEPYTTWGLDTAVELENLGFWEHVGTSLSQLVKIYDFDSENQSYFSDRQWMLFTHGLDFYVVTTEDNEYLLKHESSLSSILECGQPVSEFGYIDIERCWNYEILEEL